MFLHSPLPTQASGASCGGEQERKVQAACELMGTWGQSGLWVAANKDFSCFSQPRERCRLLQAPGPRGQRVSSTQGSQEPPSEPGWVTRVFCLD